MYKVIKTFTDLQDGNHVYLAGDEYPRNGAKADKKRIAELSGTQNNLGYSLIQALETEDDKKPAHEAKQAKKPVRSRKRAD